MKREEDEFWNVKNRPPNHYARAIARRLAVLHVLRTGNRPTYGTSGDTGDASTPYTRALRAVFDILELDVDVRGPAEWAIASLDPRLKSEKETVDRILRDNIAEQRALLKKLPKR